MTPEQIVDYRERLVNAATELRTMAEDEHNAGPRIRLQGKAQGVELALSYLDEHLRGAA